MQFSAFRSFRPNSPSRHIEKTPERSIHESADCLRLAPIAIILSPYCASLSLNHLRVLFGIIKFLQFKIVCIATIPWSRYTKLCQHARYTIFEHVLYLLLSSSMSRRHFSRISPENYEISLDN